MLVFVLLPNHLPPVPVSGQVHCIWKDNNFRIIYTKYRMFSYLKLLICVCRLFQLNTFCEVQWTSTDIPCWVFREEWKLCRDALKRNAACISSEEISPNATCFVLLSCLTLGLTLQKLWANFSDQGFQTKVVQLTIMSPRIRQKTLSLHSQSLVAVVGLLGLIEIKGHECSETLQRSKMKTSISASSQMKVPASVR